MLNILLFAETKLWGTLTILFIVGLGYLAQKVTKGVAVGYINYRMSDKRKKALVIIHGLSSTVLALAIPNNLLNKIDIVNAMYEENELWIAGSMLVLLLLFIILLGTTLTLVVANLGLAKEDKEESLLRILNG